MPAPGRRESGYRDYGHADLHRLAFIRHARDLGFSLERIRVLLALWSNAEVKALALGHVPELETRAHQLQEWRTRSGVWPAPAKATAGRTCPIITSLESGAGLPTGRAAPARARH